MTRVLILGSGPDVAEAADWARAPFDVIVAINNAWRVRDDWDVHIFPTDFPVDRRPRDMQHDQQSVQADDYVPVQNTYGGFVYAGGTMAFTAGYWALGALRPSLMAFAGCNMVYPASGATHFYGTGTADPLRPDVTLRSLPAKSARLHVHAARQGCTCVTVTGEDSVLIFPRATPDALPAAPAPFDASVAAQADAMEARLDYVVPSGKYWKQEYRFDPAQIDALDALWLRAVS
ncbi:hypothetical protein SAMN05428995_104184 [Loktanella sp. DSM 29012]|uniref:hypothetical protein n=1 Tax=Loktanella sp. DSM 29012 TaxID=1881056 RepID=UPI0008BEC8A1|nr:hypothetical protein [Loktanella sp. DSM 29012]SEQ41360.1 hypothetical protein SAMN05428995_104184 [Loktanella sp. DSM 29012]